MKKLFSKIIRTIFAWKTLVFLLIIGLLLNWFVFRKVFPFRIASREDLLVAIELIKAILSWPVALIIIAFVFIFKFSEPIRTFLLEMRWLKAGPSGLEIAKSDQQTNIDAENPTDRLQSGDKEFDEMELKISDLRKEAADKDTQIAGYQNAIEYFVQRSEKFEFLWLNTVLVLRTKFALLALYNQSLRQATKEALMILIDVPAENPKPDEEKESVFNALLVNQLIEQQEGGILFGVTNKGEKFLRFNSLIQ